MVFREKMDTRSSEEISSIEQWMLNAQNSQKRSANGRKIRVQKKGNKILYPCFEEASKLYKKKDPYWCEVLLACSKGNFPRGFSFKDKIFVYGKGKKRKEILLPDDIQSIAEICICAFRDYGLMISPNDKEKMTSDASEKETANSIDWARIRVKELKYNMLIDYVESSEKFAEKRKEYRDNLVFSLYVHSELGKIKSKNIKMKGCRIVDVVGMEILEDGSIPIDEPIVKKVKKPKAQEENKHQHYKTWVKYIYSLLEIDFKSYSRSGNTDTY